MNDLTELVRKNEPVINRCSFAEHIDHIREIGERHQRYLTEKLKKQAESEKALHAASMDAEKRAGRIIDSLIPSWLRYFRGGMNATENGYYAWIHPQGFGTLQVFVAFDILENANANQLFWSYWDGIKFNLADTMEEAIGEMFVHSYPPITEAQIKDLIYGPF